MTFVHIVGVVVALIVASIAYFKWKTQYWKRKNFPYLDPAAVRGNLAVQRQGLSMILKNTYNTVKSRGLKHCGIYIFLSPAYVPVDLELIKNILTRDFQHFVDRGVFYNEKDDPLSAHLFALDGSKWRNLRIKLTPTFTSGRMRMMLPIMIECEASLRQLIDSEIDKPVDIKDVLASFTIDVIGSCAFGLDCNAIKEKNSPFKVYGREIFNFSGWRLFKRRFGLLLPDIARAMGLVLTPAEISSFFIKVVKDTVKYRESSNFSRDDFMQLVINLMQEQKKEGVVMTIEEIAAQCFVFFIAGFETSSSTTTFALYELSKNQEVQEKLRGEIKTVLSNHKGKITYEAIHEMKYMDQVINETLRKYPVVPALTRRCVKDYKIPGENVIIEKGTRVLISTLGIHHDEEYYPDPERFDPNRFTDEACQSRHKYAHLPFGEGPRNCIGLRFGLMQTKVGLTSLVGNYKFFVNGKTREPLEFSPRHPVLSVEGGVWLNVEKLN